MTILETPRLSLRQMTPDDLPALKRTLQDPIAMTAYEPFQTRKRRTGSTGSWPATRRTVLGFGLF